MHATGGRAGDRQVKSNSSKQGLREGAVELQGNAIKGSVQMALPESATWGQWAAAAPFIHSPAASVGSCTCRVCRTGRIDGQSLLPGLFFLPRPPGRAGQGSGQGWFFCHGAALLTELEFRVRPLKLGV
ncbi:hypothetical protein KC19_1G034100 [Ceratodon purpureus]|uniref:Uncharacterized protein n=1 Tax=Ceratodon purpureus TaxID=3225 RepID=A0A8T0J1Y6_CERPU|nr:hypothetical protein KC19_1G034100 [Ceratodon purpureus]